MFKEFLWLNKKNTNAPIERWPTERTRNFTKMNQKWLTNIWKDVKTLLVMWTFKIKPECETISHTGLENTDH